VQVGAVLLVSRFILRRAFFIRLSLAFLSSFSGKLIVVDCDELTLFLHVVFEYSGAQSKITKQVKFEGQEEGD